VPMSGVWSIAKQDHHSGTAFVGDEYRMLRFVCRTDNTSAAPADVCTFALLDALFREATWIGLGPGAVNFSFPDS
jgi:hypothetical protein